MQCLTNSKLACEILPLTVWENSMTKQKNHVLSIIWPYDVLLSWWNILFVPVSVGPTKLLNKVSWGVYVCVSAVHWDLCGDSEGDCTATAGLWIRAVWDWTSRWAQCYWIPVALTHASIPTDEGFHSRCITFACFSLFLLLQGLLLWQLLYLTPFAVFCILGWCFMAISLLGFLSIGRYPECAKRGASAIVQLRDCQGF